MTSRVNSRGGRWLPLPEKPWPERRRIHVVAVSMPQAFDAHASDWAALTPAEAARARRFRFDIHRRRWLFGRLTLKQLLARYLACPMQALTLGFGEIGKPHVAQPAEPGIRFNYTDSNGHLLYVFSADTEVGVDLEFLPRKTDYEKLAPRKLTPPEMDALWQLPESERELGFLAAWTRKEAYGKALGVGIRYPMGEVTLVEDFAVSDYVTQTAEGQPVCLAQIDPPYAGIACIAAFAENIELDVYLLTTE